MLERETEVQWQKRLKAYGPFTVGVKVYMIVCVCVCVCVCARARAHRNSREGAYGGEK